MIICKNTEKNCRGFTLVEIMVATAVSMILTSIIYMVYTSSSRSYTAQDVASGVQQSIRVGTEFMVYDLRMAGCSPNAVDIFGMEEATAEKIRFTLDTLDSTLVPPDYNGTVDNNNLERITYSFDAANQQILRITDEGEATEAQVQLLDNVQAMTFAYFNEDGNDMGAPVAAVDLGDIRSVEISMTLREPAGRNEPVERTLTQRVLCRNLGL